MDLKKGQKIKLSDLTNSSKLELKTMVQLKKDTADITCFGVDDKDKLIDDRYFVFYNQTSTPERAIYMKTDPMYTSFIIDLKALPPFIKKLVVTIAADGDITMRDIVGGAFSIGSGNESYAKFSFSGADFKQEKALILCEIYEKDGIWRLSVVASGFNGGLSALLAHFGGEEAVPSSKPEEVHETPSKKDVIHIPDPTLQNIQQKKPISLKKRGESHKISLEKNKKEIHVNLNWNTTKQKGFFKGSSNNIDLDLACMYRLKTGHQGVIQALGNSFGSETDLPYIFLDKDDRTGSSANGENMWLKKPDFIEFAVVFAFIYEGTPNWKNTGAIVKLKQYGEPDIEIFIENADRSNRFCVIASLTAIGNALEVKREEKFFQGHREIDKHYGFGFQWQAGRK